MSRQITCQALVLKKQPFKEADEIITFFSLEKGKLRAIAKAVKSPKSKLQQKLQTLFLVDLTLSTSQLPTVLGAEIKEVFEGLRNSLPASKMSFYALELLLKFTPDEQPNPALFHLTLEFLSFLSSEVQDNMLDIGLAKFKIHFLEVLGLGLRFPAKTTDMEIIFFSNLRGGFVTEKSGDTLPLEGRVLEVYFAIKGAEFSELSLPKTAKDTVLLQSLLSGFLEYQLERRLKSEKFLNMV